MITVEEINSRNSDLIKILTFKNETIDENISELKKEVLDLRNTIEDKDKVIQEQEGHIEGLEDVISDDYFTIDDDNSDCTTDDISVRGKVCNIYNNCSCNSSYTNDYIR